ncbi:MAG: aminotransferase class IV [Vicinamibacterales bacterium]
MRGAAYVNGTIGPVETAAIPVLDHGFMYGEGVYEVLRTYHGEPFLYDQHIARLRRSAAAIHLDLSFDDLTLRSWIDRTAQAAALEGDTYIRILATRGIGELTYDVRATPAPSVVIVVKAQPAPDPRLRNEGIAIALVPILRNHPGSVNPIIKSNNLLNNALAMQEAHRRGAEEALMCNYRGELSECSQSNVFLIRNGVALTPRSKAGLLEGITRAFLFQVGQEVGVAVEEATLMPADLATADEMFITSTTREISPVVRIDERVIGSGKPGEVTLRLWDAYHRRALEMTSAAGREHSLGTRD